MCLALPYGCFELTSLYHDLNTVKGWHPGTKVKLSHASLAALRNYWLALKPVDMGRPWGPPSTSIVLYSDASKSGFGFHTDSDPGLGDYFPLSEALNSIDKLEMAAMLAAL